MNLSLKICFELVDENTFNLVMYIKDYVKVNSLFIKEYMLCLENFREANWFVGEIHVQIAPRLRSSCIYYCKIRTACDFEPLVNLVVSHKLLLKLDYELIFTL